MAKVNGEGPLDADIVIVGEAPGVKESQVGRPFVGMAGGLLDKIISSSGLVRRNLYLTNVFKERPPGNDIKKFLNLSSNPIKKTEAYLNAERELKEELKKTSANVIVALGQVALFALCGFHDKITKRRGSVYESTLLPGRKVVATLHPSSALRMYSQRYLIMHDFNKAVKESMYPEIRTTKANLITFPTFEESVAFLTGVLEEEPPFLAFDTEIVNDQISHVSLAYSTNEAISIAFLKGGTNFFTLDQEATLWNLIGRVLENEKISKLIHNATFDVHVVFRRYGILIKNVVDTMVAQKVANPDFPAGLDFVCSIYTNINYYKDEGKKWKSLGDEKMFNEYSAKDALALMEAWPGLLKDLEVSKNVETFQAQNKLIEPLVFMQEHGIKIDFSFKEEKRKNEEKKERLQKELNSLCNRSINPNSPKDIATYFYIQKGLPPYTKKGRWTTDEVALTRLARKGYKEAELILEIRKLTKMNSNYYNEAKISSDGRLRTVFKPATTPTGRLASGANIFGEGNNIQNYPHEAKRFMTVDEGNVGFQLDLSQAENRIVAWLGPEPTMLRAFDKGDVHALTAFMIMRRFYGRDVSKEIDVRSISPLGDGKHTWRDWGKKANHGLNYGQGYKKFSLQNQLSEKDGKMIVDSYFTMYPGVKAYHNWIVQQLSTNRTLENPFGRRRVFYGRWGSELFNEAYNFIPQSTVGDIINRWGILYIYFNPFLADVVTLLNQIHDSLEFEISIDVGFKKMAKAVMMVKRNLEQKMTFRSSEYSIPCSVKTGRNFGDFDPDRNPEGMKELEFKTEEDLEKALREIYE